MLLELAAKLDDLAEACDAEASAGWKGTESLAFVAHRLTARDATAARRFGDPRPIAPRAFRALPDNRFEDDDDPGHEA